MDFHPSSLVDFVIRVQLAGQIPKMLAGVI